MSGITKILFICHGNICRSTMAEMVLKDMVRKRGLAREFYIASAGTSREEEDNDVHYETKRILREMGIPCEHHAAIQMTREDYRLYDYLIGMDDANIRNMNRICGGDPEGKIRTLLSFTGKSGSIADPWYTGNFEETYRDVSEGCSALLEFLFR